MKATPPVSPLWMFAIVLLTAVPVLAQQVVQRRLDPTTSILFAELGAIAEVAEEDASEIKIGTVLPAQVRPDANLEIDIEQGDQILMMNGERVESIGGLREMYEALEDGDEIKLALKRGDRRFLVGFAKAPADGSGVVVRRRQAAGGGTAVRVMSSGGDVALLHEARAVLGEQEGEVRVAGLMGESAELGGGDVIVAVNGTEVSSLAEYRETYEALEVGSALSLTVRRGEQTLEVELTKAETPAGMVIRRQTADGSR